MFSFRFRNGYIYTYIGEVCVSVNPYKTMNIYDSAYVVKYKGENFMRHFTNVGIYNNEPAASLTTNKYEKHTYYGMHPPKSAYCHQRCAPFAFQFRVSVCHQLVKLKATLFHFSRRKRTS